MSELASTQVPMPENEQDFEHCNEILWRQILQDESVKTYGRRGQAQFGVDLTGFRNGKPDHLLGVQCKLKGAGKELEEDEIRNEVKKALNFEPELSEYVIVTTAPDSNTNDSLARQLTQDIFDETGREMTVSVLGWGSLSREIRRYPDAYKAFDPSHTPYAERTEQKIDELSKSYAEDQLFLRGGLSEIKSLVEDIAARKPDTVVISETVNSVHEKEINEYATLIYSDPHIALRLLSKLEQRLDDAASAQVRFRITTNMAACHLFIGETVKAAEGFSTAFSLDPENPKAVANKALSFLLVEDWKSLKAFAVDHLARQPDNAALAAHHVHGLIHDPETNDPLSRVPEGLVETPEVIHAHIRWLLERGQQGAWWDEVAEAYARHPDDANIKELYAGAQLDSIITSQGFSYGYILSEGERSKIEAAIAIYESLWLEIEEAENYHTEQISIPVNLMLAHRLNDNLKLAIDVGVSAQRQFGQSAKLKEALAAAYTEAEREDDAREIIEDLELSRETIMLHFNLAMVSKDWTKIVELVEEHQDLFPEEEREISIAGGVLANVELASASDRRKIIEDHVVDLSNSSRGCALLSQAARKHNFEDLSKSLFDAALSAFDAGDNSPACRTTIAYQAMARGSPKIAADMLCGHVPLVGHCSELATLAEALALEYPVRERAVHFFETLPDQFRSLAEYSRSEGIHHYNRGVYDQSAECFARALDTEPRLDTALKLVSCYVLLGDESKARAVLEREDLFELKATPLERIEFSHAVQLFGDTGRAVRLGYDALIDGLEDHRVVMKYLGLFLKPLVEANARSSETIQAGDWIELSGPGGQIFSGIVGEANERAWGTALDEKNEFVSKSLGLRAGDTFDHQSTIGITERWTVVDNKPRELRAFQVLADSFNQRFPQARGFSRLTASAGDVEPALNQLRQISEAQRERADLYLIDHIPLSIVAKSDRGGSISFSEYLRSIDQDVRVCLGAADERVSAIRLIKGNKSAGAVLDAYTAWVGAKIGLLGALAKTLGPLSIPTTELQVLNELLDEIKTTNGDEALFLSFRDGEFIRHVATREELEAQREQVTHQIAEIQEYCSVEPLTIPDNLGNLGESIVEMGMGDAIAPALLTGPNRLFLSEDMRMRQFADAALGAKGIWLQVALMEALSCGIITLETYADSLVELISLRHNYVSVDFDDLKSVYDRSDTDDLQRFAILSGYVGVKNADFRSHIKLAARFINAIWEQDGDKIKANKATSIILRNLLTRNRGDLLLYWGAALYLKLEANPKKYFHEWCRGHFLPIVEIINTARTLSLSIFKRKSKR